MITPNEDYAALVASIPMGQSSKVPSKGWKYIGAGAYRRAYLAPDGLVYKHQYDSDFGEGDPDLTNECNDRELQIFLINGESVKALGFRLAECAQASNGINVMEYVDDKPFRKYHAELERWARVNDLWDLCGDNVKTNSKGEIVVVDYAT